MELFDEVVVATDDARVADAAGEVGVESLLTSPTHRNGTERVAEVADLPRFRLAEIVVNLQGDEPFVAQEAVAGAIGQVEGSADIGTAAGPIEDSELTNPDVVKVEVDRRGRAAAFYRLRSGSVPLGDEASPLHHIGVYAYRPDALRRWAATEPVADEISERLEQLRPLSYGASIGVATITDPAPPGINTMDDLKRAEQLLAISCSVAGRLMLRNAE